MDAAGSEISGVQFCRGLKTVRRTACRNWTKKSVVSEQRLHLLVVSLPVALILIKEPFLCIFREPVGEQTLIERSITRLGFSGLPEYSPSPSRM